MTLQKLLILTVAVAALGFMGCGKNDAGRVDAGGNAGGNTGSDASSDACPGIPGVSTLGEVPNEHRATATTCSPTATIAPTDAALAACTTDADCVGDGGTPTFYAYCLHGLCSADQCLSDSDCTNAVCGCGADQRAPASNVCVPGNCRTDADCGSGGYCSPTRGYCGSFQSFYCHGPSDTCVNATTDCGSCGGSCLYAPTVGAFTCGSAICAG